MGRTSTIFCSGAKPNSAARAARYEALILQALRDVQDDPERPGAKSRPDLLPEAYTYHLSFSRNRVTGDKVRTPRHIVLYRLAGGTVEFARILHDSRDLAQHLPAVYQNEQ